MLHQSGSPNVAPGLLDTLGALVGTGFAGPVPVEDRIAYLAAVIAHPGYPARFADELTTPGIRVPITADPTLWAEAVELGRAVVWAHTYGARSAEAPDRPAGDVRFPTGDERRIANLSAVTEMPTNLDYVDAAHELRMGTERWRPVPRTVFDYAAGGKNVLRSWFSYRKAEPGGRKSSPLDHMHVESWPGEWSTEFTDLLSVLTRLVDAGPAQGDLLNRIMDGPLLTLDTLAQQHGVRWPTGPADRRPKLTAAIPEQEEATDRLF